MVSLPVLLADASVATCVPNRDITGTLSEWLRRSVTLERGRATGLFDAAETVSSGGQRAGQQQYRRPPAEHDRHLR